MAKRLSIFAGQGQLVQSAISSAVQSGYSIQLLSLTDRADLDEFNPVSANISNPISILLKLRSFKPTHICMVGGLSISDKQREGLLGFLRGKSRRQRTTGDTGLSRLIGALEFSTGAKVIGVHEIVPDLCAREGLLAGPEISAQNLQDCAFALKIAQEIGRLDIGQAVISSGQRIVGVEDIGGTDALMGRVKEFVAQGKIGNGRGTLILAKAKKPNQPATTDLPAIGPDTILQAKASSVSIVCIEAENSLLIDKEKLFELANKLDISVLGLRSEM